MNNQKQYRGLYVAKKSFAGKGIIASGKDVRIVFMQAKKITKDPVIFYMPRVDTLIFYTPCHSEERSDEESKTKRTEANQFPPLLSC